MWKRVSYKLRIMEGTKLAILFLVMIGMLSVISACSLLPQEEEVLAPPLVEPAEVEYNTSEVIRDEIVQRVGGVANFTATQMVNLHFQDSGGRIEELNVRNGEEVSEGDVLVQLESGNLEFDIQQAEFDLRKAEIHLNQLRDQNADPYSIEIAEVDIESIELRLTQMRQELDRAQLIAPRSGHVTFVSDHSIGDHVDPFETLVQLADPTELNLIYSATNANALEEVDLGMSVTVDYNGEELEGEVVQTPRDLPEDIPEDSRNLFQRSIIIEVSDRPDDVEMGDMANIEVITQRQDDTLIIPRGGLRSYMGRDYVQVMDEDQSLREVDVETGIITSTEVEIIRGLDEGDHVIMR